MHPSLLLLTVFCFPLFCHAQNNDDDMANNFRKGLEAAEQKRVSELQPKTFIDGSLFTDSAYHIRFRFSPGDSIVDKSANGQVVIVLTNGFYFLRMNAGNPGVTLEKYAEGEHGQTESHQPAGATHYKVGKLKHDKSCYCYRYGMSWTDKDGRNVKGLTRIQYTDRYGALKLIAIFPDDAAAAEKEEKTESFARTVDTWVGD